MATALLRLSLQHRGAITIALLLALILNLTVIGRMAPPDASDLQDGLPAAARCQGGGPGCAAQPLIPPPAGGLTRFDGPAAPFFGALVLVQAAVPAALIESPPADIERPPVLNIA